MSTANRFPTDSELEAALRAMLQRRAADVHPVPVDVGATRHQHTGGSPGREQPGPSASVARLDRPQGQAGRRWVLVAAAVLLLVAGAVGVARLAAGDGATTETGSPTGDGPPLIIWPLGAEIPADLLATPESATRAYLADVAGVGPDVSLDRTVVDGVRATVHYTLGGTPSTVSLIQRDGRWYVTGATNELAVIDWVTAPDDRFVDVEVVSGPGAATPDRLRARLIGADGRVIDTADVAFQDGNPVENPGPPLRDGPWHTQLFVTTGAVPVAVRVDVLSPNADNDAVLAHAAVAIPGASAASNPPATPTSASPLTVDPDPEPLPPGPDRLPALRTETGEASGAAPDPLGLDGWQDAATDLINTAVDEDSPGGRPVFAEVSEDSNNLVVRGRYAMPDGDAGTFELVRLDNGDWGMTSLRSDGLELGQIGRTGARVQVTLVSAKDADLGVGGFRVGLEPGQPWVRAGEEAVFSVPCRDSVAVLYQFLDAHDGMNLRFAEAWPC
jgi:hypothetical protein